MRHHFVTQLNNFPSFSSPYFYKVIPKQFYITKKHAKHVINTQEFLRIMHTLHVSPV